MTRRRLLVLIPLVALALNGLAYFFFVRSRTGSAPSSPSASSDRVPGTPPPPTTTTREQPAASGPVPAKEGEVAASVPDSEKQKEQTAMARRAAGMAALEAGDYDKALIHFTEARALLGDRARVGDLLRVTEDLRNGGGHARATSNRNSGASGSPRGKARNGSDRRVALGEADAPMESGQLPAGSGTGAENGLLIVTTTPRGLLVQVDDTAIDLTPMRTKVRPGTHRVVLLDGDRRVYETTIDVKEGATATLLKDLVTEASSEATRPPPIAVSPPPAAVSPAPTPREDVVAVGSPQNDLPPPAAVRRTADSYSSGGADSMGTGGLEISSPGLYGVVWVNGRPRGYPPLVVRGLPAGPAKVEVRVNGVQKRLSTVNVKPGSTVAIKLKSSEIGAP